MTLIVLAVCALGALIGHGIGALITRHDGQHLDVLAAFNDQRRSRK